MNKKLMGGIALVLCVGISIVYALSPVEVMDVVFVNYNETAMHYTKTTYFHGEPIAKEEFIGHWSLNYSLPHFLQRYEWGTVPRYKTWSWLR